MKSKAEIKIVLFLMLVIGLFGFGVSMVSPQETRIAKGVFVRFFWGDYLYLTLNEAGKDIDYYCNIPKCAEWEMNEATLKNKKVLLRWRESDFFFKQLNLRKKNHEVVDIEFAK